jgi:hypothetical protein
LGSSRSQSDTNLFEELDSFADFHYFSSAVRTRNQVSLLGWRDIRSLLYHNLSVRKFPEGERHVAIIEADCVDADENITSRSEFWYFDITKMHFIRPIRIVIEVYPLLHRGGRE